MGDTHAETMHALAVLLLETDETTVEADDRAHKRVAVGAVPPLVLLEPLDLEEERLLLSDLGGGKVEQLGRILLALDLAVCRQQPPIQR